MGEFSGWLLVADFDDTLRPEGAEGPIPEENRRSAEEFMAGGGLFTIATGRDPRSDLPAPLTRQNIVKLSDIKVGTILRGTIRNVTDFGAFMDIGIKTAGLIHISHMSQKRIKHPLDVVSAGETVQVKVISVDEGRGRIGLALVKADA